MGEQQKQPSDLKFHHISYNMFLFTSESKRKSMKQTFTHALMSPSDGAVS